MVSMAQKPPPKKRAAGGKKRKRKVKLTLKSRTIKDEGGYSDRVGWSSLETSGRVLDDAPKDAVPDIWKHQCSSCGSMLQIPRPKRDRYKVVCPHCEQVDELSMTGET